MASNGEGGTHSQQDAKSRRPRVLRPFPVHSLEEALQIVHTIGEMNAAKPMDRLLLADAMGIKQASSEYRALLSSSIKYGLTEGNEKSEFINPTPLGLRIIKPLSAEERAEAIRVAVLTPELFERIYRHYNRSKLPKGSFFLNTLERQFGVPAQWCEELSAMIHTNARFAGLVQSISGDDHIMLTAPLQPPAVVAEGETAEEHEEESAPDESVEGSSNGQVGVAIPPTEQASKPKQIFLAHGKNREPLEQLKKILDKFKIPYRVAIDEAHAGRPISFKVASLMESCSAAIFIFTKDEEFHNAGGESVWRPSENVVYELGAAAMLYGSKIIIFKEEGIKFASDFQDLGYITFRPGEISSKALDLLSELIALDFIRVLPV
jgi:hypothetical protein